jgi:2-haloacid dehalogenase
MDLTRFDTLTFDCYGTLIDWETGLLHSLGPLLTRHGVSFDEDELLALFAQIEARIENEGFRPYRDVLIGTLEALAAHYGFVPTPGERVAFPESLGTWPPFPDSVDALRRLSKKYTLVALTNCDDDLFAKTAALLGNPFDAVFTAQSVGSYKPHTAHFLKAMERFGRDNVLHVAQSLYHDIGPASALGLATCHVRRPQRATKPARAEADWSVSDLQTLANSLLQ